MSKSFEALQKHTINLELDLQQCKEKIKNDESFKENQSNVFLKEQKQYFEIQDLKAQLQDKGVAISELKKLIEQMKGKSVETKFKKSSVIRQPIAFKSQRQSILGKPPIFSDSLAKKDFSKSKSYCSLLVLAGPQPMCNLLNDRSHVYKSSREEARKLKDHHNMANENVSAPALTRSDDQILPFAAWVPIGKSNFVLDLQKKKKNPIFQISVDILQNTNFFRAFTASASVLAICSQQFWNTLTFEAKTRAYSFQLDENRFILDANLLRGALEITLIDQAHQFVSRPSGDAIMDFVNELGYTKELHFVSRMAMNNLYQPWRAILSMINQCLTCKTSGFDRPKYPVLQMLWGIITSTNIDYAELTWEEFVQAIQTFLADKANMSIAPQKGKKTKPHVIPYCRFTKLIICYLGRTHNIHQRFASLFHLAEEDHRHGNLKFVPKGEEDEVFGMQIPKELITNNIRNTPYYNAYLEMVAKHDQKITAEKGGKKKPATAKQPKPVSSKQSKPATAKQPKPNPVKEKSTKPTPLQKASKAPEPQVEDEEFDLQRGIQMSLESLQAQGQAPVGGITFHELASGITQKLLIVEGKGKWIATDEQAAQSLLELQTPKKTKTGASTNKTSSEGDTEILNIGEEQGEDVADKVNLEEKTAEIDEGQAGLDPDPEPMHDDFVATVYPQVHESLKHPDEEHAQVENPLSLTGTLSSMKNLDAYTFGDQFFNDKPTEEEPDKANMETEDESMVTVLIHQASSYVPLLSTPVINLTPPKPDKTSQALLSRIFTLELRDLPHKINQTVNEVVKEAVHVALQAPLRDRFRELPEGDMKEILHQRMFESGTYKSLLEHRHCDDQDPPPPSPDSNLSKKKRHDSGVLGTKQPPVPQSSVWKTSNTREDPSSSSKQKSVPHSEQPVKDVPIPDDMNISDSEDTDTTHLPKIKTRPDWLKPVPEEDRPATPEPDWVIPLNDLPKTENN
ncbi:hypothetical protein Tco_0642657 [Tanacetum coccineum]